MGLYGPIRCGLPRMLLVGMGLPNGLELGCPAEAGISRPILAHIGGS